MDNIIKPISHRLDRVLAWVLNAFRANKDIIIVCQKCGRKVAVKIKTLGDLYSIDSVAATVANMKTYYPHSYTCDSFPWGHVCIDENQCNEDRLTKKYGKDIYSRMQ